MWKKNYQDCLFYIDAFWDKVTCRPTRIQVNVPLLFPSRTISRHVYRIPYPFITPNNKKFNTVFYWDSFFMFRGLMGTKRAYLMKAMVNNFEYLFNKYNIIPNSNHAGFINRSQPPLLTSMILDVYFTPHISSTLHQYAVKLLPQVHNLRQKRWLFNAIETAKKEYFLVWLDMEGAYNHKVPGYSLARYGDRDIGYAHSSELESGWDFTSRFYNRCSDFLPIDLNIFLYKYEKDFADIAKLFRQASETKKWLAAAESRKQEINTYMWNETEGFFYDFGYSYKKISTFLSLAGFTPLWAGLATRAQAKKMLKKLSKFETKYGLAITAKESLAKPIDLSTIQRRYHPAIKEIIEPKQWDWPNIWPPLEYLTVIGLLKYGFIHRAYRIMKNSVEAHAAAYRTHHTFFEKLNGETGKLGTGALYEDQRGFGWTNAIFFRYIDILDALDSTQSIYVSEKGEPPYSLSILH